MLNLVTAIMAMAMVMATVMDTTAIDIMATIARERLRLKLLLNQDTDIMATAMVMVMVMDTMGTMARERLKL